jgi:hypothetical protein
MQTNEIDLKRANILGFSGIQQLVDDLFMEFDPHMKYADNRSAMPRFGMILWYVRNYTYAPMRVIGHCAGVGSSDKRMAYRTAECIDEFVKSCPERPVYLNGDTYEALQLMKSVGSFYNLEKNLPMERLHDDVVDALLYLTSLECKGWGDYSRPQGGARQEMFRPTPRKQPRLVTILDLEARLSAGANLWEIEEDYLIDSINNL